MMPIKPTTKAYAVGYDSNMSSSQLVRPVQDILEDMKPSKSSKAYDVAYDNFIKQVQLEHGVPPKEEQLLGYFDFLRHKKKLAPSSLWTVYSQLNRMVQLHHGFKLQRFPRITMLLKSAQVGYKRKVAKVFTLDQIYACLKKDTYILPAWIPKKALVCALFCGGLRCIEARQILFHDIQRTDDGFYVQYVQGKQKGEQKENHFLIPFNHDDSSISFGRIFQDYYDLVIATFPKIVEDKSAPLFFNVHKSGQLVNSPMGMHTVGNVGKDVARLLSLTDIDSYTGHCFRRSAATQAAKAGASTPALKTHFGWTSENTAQKYIDSTDSSCKKMANFVTARDEKGQTAQSTIQISKVSDTMSPKQGTNVFHIHGNPVFTFNYV